jgi:EAL domain-containing protein (putative c-di-GMP-specific phosphodiesterase class I)
MVRPDQFIPLAEELGLISPIGEWVLKTACTEAAKWPSDLKLAVNLSAAQFKRGNLVNVVRGALIESGLAPERLELEITESVLLTQNAYNLALLRGLKQLGVCIVLDDFGTGFSSLSYLRMFPFDTIKIDRSFVCDVSTREDCAAIISAVTSLSRALGIRTTAEGVETREQFELLRAAGCTLAQGFMLSKPRPAAELDFSPPFAALKVAS